MKFIKLLVLSLSLTSALYSQKSNNKYAITDRKIKEIPASATTTTKELATYINTNFITEADKARAIFIWLANNIEYDIANVYAMNFYEKNEDRIKRALALKKGICSHYAALFHDIGIKSGLETYIIEGYTMQNGFTDYIPHAWCAAKVDNVWYLFDPTWGAGYIENGTYHRRLKENYFMAKPSQLIKSHMPFDYLWQFLNYPVTNDEFYAGEISANTSKQYFSYPDSISEYNKQTRIEQLQATARRIEANGLKNSMIFDRLQHVTLELENTKQNQAANAYNGAVVNCNDAINGFNAYIKYYNKQFTPAKEDAEIQAMLDNVAGNVKEARNKLAGIDLDNENIGKMVAQMEVNLGELETELSKQQTWLTKYFSKGKLGRKTAFQKITWMGIPLN